MCSSELLYRGKVSPDGNGVVVATLPSFPSQDNECERGCSKELIELGLIHLHLLAPSISFDDMFDIYEYVLCMRKYYLEKPKLTQPPDF